MAFDAASYGRYAAGEYLEYQKKYASQIRESDRVIIEMVRKIVNGRAKGETPLSLLDIGCSSGNLLYHLKHHIPGLELSGGDAFPAIVDRCQQDPKLAGINFERMDLLHLHSRRSFDIVVVNAVLCLFGETDFDRAIANIASVTRERGHFMTFDLFHPEEQELTILEKSETHPGGLTSQFRPFSKVRTALEKHGFASIVFKPFSIPIDLPKPQREGDITSHTVRTESGKRLIFRGTLFTPWCHLVAQKA